MAAAGLRSGMVGHGTSSSLMRHAKLSHPASRLLPSNLPWTTVGPLPRGGSGNTVGNTNADETFRQTSGATFRVVIDVGGWDNSVAMNSPGQSGDPRSEHYSDLFEPWAGDQCFPLLYSREQVDKHADYRFTLQPPQ